MTSFLSIEFRTFEQSQSEDPELFPTITIFEDSDHYFLATNLNEIATAILYLVPHLDTDYRSTLHFHVHVRTGNRDAAFLSFLRSRNISSPPQLHK